MPAAAAPAGNGSVSAAAPTAVVASALAASVSAQPVSVSAQTAPLGADTIASAECTKHANADGDDDDDDDDVAPPPRAAAAASADNEQENDAADSLEIAAMGSGASEAVAPADAAAASASAIEASDIAADEAREERRRIEILARAHTHAHAQHMSPPSAATAASKPAAPSAALAPAVSKPSTGGRNMFDMFGDSDDEGAAESSKAVAGMFSVLHLALELCVCCLQCSARLPWCNAQCRICNFLVPCSPLIASTCSGRAAKWSAATRLCRLLCASNITRRLET